MCAVIVSRIVRMLTGRQYQINADDLGYMIDKGGASYLRGLIWCLLRGRAPSGLLLGRGVKIVAARRLHLGQGVSIGAFSSLDCSSTDGVHLADGVTIREYCWLQCRSGLNSQGVGLTIGKNAYVGPFAILGAGGPVGIGEGTQIGGRLSIAAESHVQSADGSHVDGSVTRAGVFIGDHCWVGNDVSIVDGVAIGAGAVIGAGSVVIRDVPPGKKAVGSPARILN